MQSVLSGESITGVDSVFNANPRSAGIKNCLIFLALFLAGFQQADATGLSEAAQKQHALEHAAVLDLVPVAQAKRQVVNSGAWSNPATWTGGQLPKAGENVYVPPDKALTVDVESDDAIKTLRADGVLKFATSRNVRLKLDTLVVSDTGSIEIGSETEPVPSDNKIEIQIADNGPINRSWDPVNVSRGVIIQGKTRIFGAVKSPFHKLAINPALGAEEITLSQAPTGWQVGDLIAITATKFRPWLNRNTTEDELRKIKAIAGTRITLGQVEAPSVSDPLKYSHVPTIPNMPVFVANFSRNVIISGEGGEDVPPSQRGHFMVMHNPDAIIKGAGFYYLGRTDKSKPIDDFKLASNGYRLKGSNGKYIQAANNNPRGRYPVHFHHTGLDPAVPPVICAGNAVFSSAGWGFVNHTSHVMMEDNASFNVLGSHYVAEEGNEMGGFRHNIAIRAIGRPSYIKYGQGNHDMGHTGHGFWLESRNLVMQDNVVSGVNNSGVAYWHRNEVPGSSMIIPKENLLTANKQLLKDKGEIHYEKIPITHEKNTTVLASFGALDVIKSSPKQNHDVRSMIESFKAYSVLNGIGIQYTEKYTLRDVQVIADAAATRPWFRGMTLMPQVKDLVLVNSSINGFVHPVSTGTHFNGKQDATEVTFVNTTVNGRPIKPSSDIHTISNAVVHNYNASYQKVAMVPGNMLAAGAGASKLRFASAASLTGNFPKSYNNTYVFKGEKIDGLGSAPFVSEWNYYQLMGAVKEGYYTDSAGNRYVFLRDLIADRLTGETKEIVAKLKLIGRYKELGPQLGTM